MPGEPQTAATAPGFALLALGFRPFYLLAGAYAALSVRSGPPQYAGLACRAQPALARARNAVRLCLCGDRWLSADRGARLDRAPRREAPARRHRRALGRGAALPPVFTAGRQPADALFALALAWGIGRPIFASGNRNWFFVASCSRSARASIAFQADPRTALAAGPRPGAAGHLDHGGRRHPGLHQQRRPGRRRAPQPWVSTARSAR